MIMKFDDVLRMLTWVVEVPRARALVKSVHIMPLKTRFRPKNICLLLVRTTYINDYIGMK